MQQEKLQNSLDKAQNEVDHLQEKLDKSVAEIRRVWFIFKKI
jgi:peptidoglycan hydrolase CwlO-like protein